MNLLQIKSYGRMKLQRGKTDIQDARLAHFKPFVERLLKAGKPPKVIIIAIMRKPLMIAHSVLKSDLPFDAERYKCA